MNEQTETSAMEAFLKLGYTEEESKLLADFSRYYFPVQEDVLAEKCEKYYNEFLQLGQPEDKAIELVKIALLAEYSVREDGFSDKIENIGFRISKMGELW